MKKSINVAVIYYSMTGNNSQFARWAAESAREEGADVRLLKIDDMRTPDEKNPAWVAEHERSRDVPAATSDDLVWADAIVFCYATRYGGLAAPMKSFIDQQGAVWSQGKLVDKVVTGITSAMNPHGGQEMALLNLYISMAHWGAIPAFPGYTHDAFSEAGGNPYGTSTTVGPGITPGDEAKAAIVQQVKRAIDIAARLKAGSADR